MRWSHLIAAAGLLAPLGAAPGRAQETASRHLNPIIPLLEAGRPVLGIVNPPYAPAVRRGAEGAAATPPPPVDIAAAAQATVAYRLGDYLYNSFSNATLAEYRDFLKAIVAAGGSAATHPLLAKIPILHGREATTLPQLVAQLNEGQVGVAMQEVETVAEIDAALAAMRFTSRGGTRPESGFENAAAYWKMTPAEYLRRADVWPLDPDGELVLTIIVESKPGLANVRALAAHPGVPVVIMGAGTLGGVFTVTNPDGSRTRDQAGFDAAAAQILAACKEFHKACGYPVNNPAEVEAAMKAGWDFFILQRRDQNAFDGVLTGRRLGGRPVTAP